MEKKTEEIIIKMDTYIAKDGRKFHSEMECRDYEDHLRMKNVRTEEFDNLYPFFSSFYYIDSVETLEFLIRYQFGGMKKTINDNPVKVGDWVAVRFEYNSNGADDYDLITIDELYTEIINAMNKTVFGDNQNIAP